MAVLEAELVSSAPQFQTLTLKQKSFVRHYLETGNATEAARRAGYDGTENTLRGIGYDNLRLPHIAAQIKRLCDPIADAQEVLERMTMYSRASIADVLTDSGSFDLETAKKKGSDALIKKLKFDKDTGNVVDLEIHDAKDATLILAKVHQLLSEKSQIELSLSDNDVSRLAHSLVPALIEAAQRARVKRLESTSSRDSLTDETSRTE